MVKVCPFPPTMKILILENGTCIFNYSFTHWRAPNWFLNTSLLRRGGNNGLSPLQGVKGRTVKNAEKIRIFSQYFVSALGEKATSNMVRR